MIHIIPLNDIKEHIESPNCPCKPEVEKGLVVIHNSFDKRELIEKQYENQKYKWN